MKRVKILIASVLFCAMGYTGSAVHGKLTMSEAEKFMQANIEALTLDEPGGATTHTLDCGKGTIKMCEATCGICQVTLKVWGAGSPNKLTCSR